MANTQNYINHLLQNTGITPACSEEERLAAEDIAQIFRNHGFDPEVQEFNAPAPSRLAFAVTGILAFAGALLMGIGGGIGLVGTLLTIVGAVLYVLERTGHPVVSRLGKTGVSQNVIAYHKASGPLASPRNRPVVVVAHYDSPRAELLAREPYASYRALIAKLLPVATVAPAAVAILRILPLPGALKVLLWIVAILASLVALANAANIISNRHILPYTSGAVCNKSSVAAMLGVMDNVAPFQGENEFPDDVPFDTYFGEQKRRAEEMARAAAEYAAAQQQNDYGNTIEYEEPTYAEDEFGQPIAPDTQSEPEQGEAFDEQIAAAQLREARGRGAAREARALLVVDNTVPGVFGCDPLRLGAVLSLDASDRVCAGKAPRKLVAASVARSQLKRHRVDAAAECAHALLEGRGLAKLDLTADEAAALERGLDSLDVRMQAHFDRARALAEYLAANEMVRNVRYPGLSSHPDHAVATGILEHGFGPAVEFDLIERSAGKLFDALPGEFRTSPAGGATTRLSAPRVKQGSTVRLFAGTDDPLVVASALDNALRKLATL